MRYVILKKINDTWFATRNRYTAKEIEVLVDKLYNDVVNFEVIDDGACQGLDDGVIIIKDDGRELNQNGVYLTDDLTKETTTTNNNHYGLFAVLFFMVWFALGVYGVLFLGAVFVIAKVYNYYENTDETTELPEDHKAIGMM